MIEIIEKIVYWIYLTVEFPFEVNINPVKQIVIRIILLIKTKEHYGTLC